MAYQYTNSKGQVYFLHAKEVTLRGSGRLQTIYYFSKNASNGAIDEIPEGFAVTENKRTGLPVLKRK